MLESLCRLQRVGWRADLENISSRFLSGSKFTLVLLSWSFLAWNLVNLVFVVLTDVRETQVLVILGRFCLALSLCEYSDSASL